MLNPLPADVLASARGHAHGGPAADAGQLAAVLFDMDGTVLDSEEIWELALDELAASLGGVLSASARESMVGSTLDRSIRILHHDLGVAADHDASAGFLLRRTTELFATHLEFKPGALELLQAVRSAGLPMALVTSTHRALTEIALDWIGRDYFAASVCGDEVLRSKPDAAPYLRAAELMNLAITSCVAIEDSPIGIAAAEAAGCAVLAVPSEVPIPQASTRTLRSSLIGVGVPDLQRILQSHRVRSAR